MSKSKPYQWLQDEMNSIVENYKMNKKLVLFGCGDLARIAYEYFTNDSEYTVVGFTVDEEYLREPTLLGLPVVPFHEVETYFPPENHDMHVCIVYKKMNRCRQGVCKRAKEKRYDLASYISSKAFVSPNAKIGEHCFLFEGNVIQSYVHIGDNCILWSGNHVGHHSDIGSNVFISSHVVISGWCKIGSNSFVGVNSTLANNTRIGKESWITHGSILGGVIPDNSFVRPVHSEITPLNESVLDRALDRASRSRQ